MNIENLNRLPSIKTDSKEVQEIIDNASKGLCDLYVYVSDCYIYTNDYTIQDLIQNSGTTSPIDEIVFNTQTLSVNKACKINRELYAWKSLDQNFKISVNIEFPNSFSITPKPDTSFIVLPEDISSPKGSMVFPKGDYNLSDIFYSPVISSSADITSGYKNNLRGENLKALHESLIHKLIEMIGKDSSLIPVKSNLSNVIYESSKKVNLKKIGQILNEDKKKYFRGEFSYNSQTISEKLSEIMNKF